MDKDENLAKVIQWNKKLGLLGSGVFQPVPVNVIGCAAILISDFKHI